MNQTSYSAIQRLPVPMPSADLALLEARKLEESSFHDEWRGEHRAHIPAGNERWYEAAGPVRRHIAGWLDRHVPGGSFLDYACGDGSMALRAADTGASFAVGIDISLGSVERAERRARERGYGPEKVRYLQRDCENTQLPQDAFTTAVCAGMLHHLDLDRAFPELFRIMAPGGRVICIEALAYNPLIQEYRRQTPELRTAWEAEHILSAADFDRARAAGFVVENVRHWFLLSPLGALLPPGRLRAGAISALQLVDQPLCRIPWLKWWSWQITFELMKPAR
jgi:SAM-dependent methyltransferase